MSHDGAFPAGRLEPACIWFTGVPASGKSTLALLLEARLRAEGRAVSLLDGDVVRRGLCSDLGFSEADRAENVRRVSQVARMMVDAGLIVLAAFVSPYGAEREKARALFAPGGFIEVFVDASTRTCERRDPKGLYARARRGEIADLSGFNGPYEAPGSPEVHLRTDDCGPEASLALLLEGLARTGRIRGPG